MKIVFTGGHPSPAFACIEYIQNEYPDWQLAMIGREYSLPSAGQKAWESATAAEHAVPFFGIDTGRSTGAGLATIRNAAKIVKSVIKARQILQKEKPDVVVSFGSYVAVPIALAAKTIGIPVITHEQVHGAGKANKLISKFAEKIALSHDSSEKYFPAGKSVTTGLPLRPVLFKTQSMPEWLIGVENKPLLVIMGGSTGSTWINELVGRVIEALSEVAVVVHQTGLPSKQQNWLEKAESIRQELPVGKASSYVPRATFSANELSWLYQQAALVVSRAGANTVAELLAFTVPTIFIPLPTSAAGEQQENARHAAAQSKVMSVVDQNTTTDGEFITLIKGNLDHKRTKTDFTFSLKPQEKITELIQQVVK